MRHAMLSLPSPPMIKPTAMRCAFKTAEPESPWSLNALELSATSHVQQQHPDTFVH
jgi:hypothetical protein